MPKVSILLPTYKEPQYLIRSITSVLNQSFSDWELIVIDDGLVQNSKKSLFDFVQNDKRITVITNPQNLGIQKSLNEGLKAARGTYVARIDDDDEWIDTKKLHKQVAFLDEHFEYVLVGTGAVIVAPDGQQLTKYLLPESDIDIRKRILSKNCFIHSSVMFNKEKVLSLGGYSESDEVKHIEDYDLWLRLGQTGKMYIIPDYLIDFTLHKNSISSKNRRAQFKGNVKLTRKFKHAYPNYGKNLFIANIRMFLYPLFDLIPDKLKYKFFKFYKEL